MVEIRDGVLEFLGQEVGHAAREIDAGLAGTKLERPLEILEGSVIVAEAALGDGPVVETVGKDRVEPDGSIEIRLCATQVAEVVLGNAAEEETPIVRGVQPGEDVEILDGLCILAVGKRLAPPPHEDVLVILGERKSCAEEQRCYGQEKLFHYFCKDKQ